MTKSAQKRRYYRKNRMDILSRGYMRRKHGDQWWIGRAFIKAGGSVLDWPRFRNTKNIMKPQELIEGLRNLAMQCPIDATVFRVPSAPSCTGHQMRLDVSPKDIIDLLQYIEQLQNKVSGNVTELPAWSLQP